MIRSGRKTGPASPRMMARMSPKARTKTSAIMNSWMFTTKAFRRPGRDSQKTWALKNDAWTSGQPGAWTTTQPTSPKTATVLTIAIALERTARGSGPRRRVRTVWVIPRWSPRRGRAALRLDDRHRVLEREPGAGQLVERAVGGQ